MINYFSIITTLLISLSKGIPIANKTNNEMEKIEGISTSNFIEIDDMILIMNDAKSGLLHDQWPEGVLPYVFADSITPIQHAKITKAIEEISSNTCIQFRPANTEDTYSLEFQNDYVKKRCSSIVGWQEIKNQPIYLHNHCTRGQIMHELMHTLGFFHEHTRKDRDEYVVIHTENIESGKESNFLKDTIFEGHLHITDYGVVYNYDSIMHYGKNAFSKNGNNTIEVTENPKALGSGNKIGQREMLSIGDIMLINKRYNCTQTNAGAVCPFVARF